MRNLPLVLDPTAGLWQRPPHTQLKGCELDGQLSTSQLSAVVEQ